MYPIAIFAVTFAIGYPVAFDAKADERLTLGFTSITAYSKLFGFRANCTLHPPSILSAEIIFIAFDILYPLKSVMVQQLYYLLYEHQLDQCFPYYIL